MAKQKLRDLDLDFWIKHNKNVLFIGEAGTGKTARILEAFERNKLNFRYYSASTMDPWVDFIGIPKEVKDANGNSELSLIRPKEWAEDTVEAIFLDEFNRAPAKVRNAVMELIQFKSINGKKFKNLKIIWAAINPEESENPNATYDVEPLDPAQKDRFHVHVNIPYECSASFFEKKHGIKGRIAVEWWRALSKDIKFQISPRRLDFILETHTEGGSLDFLFPPKIDVLTFERKLDETTYLDQLQKLLDQKNNQPDLLTNWLSKLDNFEKIRHYLSKNSAMENQVLPYLSEEFLATYYFALSNSKKSSLRNRITSQKDKHEVFSSFYDTILAKEASKVIVEDESVYKFDNFKSDLFDEFFLVGDPNRLPASAIIGTTRPNSKARKKALEEFLYEPDTTILSQAIKMNSPTNFGTGATAQMANLVSDHLASTMNLGDLVSSVSDYTLNRPGLWDRLRTYFDKSKNQEELSAMLNAMVETLGYIISRGQAGSYIPHSSKLPFALSRNGYADIIPSKRLVLKILYYIHKNHLEDLPSAGKEHMKQINKKFMKYRADSEESFIKEMYKALDLS